MDAFYDGVCPSCGGYTYGMPLHCDRCGWRQSEQAAERMKEILDDIFASVFDGDAGCAE